MDDTLKGLVGDDKIDIVIISAKYGVLRPDTLIEYYDMIMTRTRAEEMRSAISDALETILDKGHYSQIFVLLDPEYMEAIEPGLLSSARSLSSITPDSLDCLREWLRQSGGGTCE